MRTLSANSIIICLLILQSFITSLSAQTSDQKKALDLIFNKNIVDTSKSEIYISKWMVPKDTIIELWDEKITVPYNCYLIFVDDHPMAEWSHPCRYIFVNLRTGNDTILNRIDPIRGSLKKLFIQINNIKWPNILPSNKINYKLLRIMVVRRLPHNTIML